MRLLGLIALMVFATFPSAAGKRSAVAALGPSAARVSAVRSGSVHTRDGLQLTLNADTGSVHVFTDASGEVRYAVRVEAEGNDPAAAALLKQFSLDARGTANGVMLSGRMRKAGDAEKVFVSYEVHLPRRYSLAITTRVGDIVTQDIDGQVSLTTGGGNIQAGRIGGGLAAHPDISALAARLNTGGGHILVGDVVGALRASTAGGHITAGNVGGDAVLHTDGGHIQVGSVDGTAQLTTGGGNISVARADSGATAETAGGRIDFGEVAGSVHARSGGGGVHVAHVAGPTVLDSSDGGIFLADVAAPLHASTATGGITAWFAPQFGGTGGSGGAARAGAARAASELSSGSGDIVIYVPREIAATIDAQIAQGSPHRIVADPALPVKVRYQQASSGHALHALATFNGGGPVVHLKTGAGDIQLRFLDADIERQLAAQQAASAQQRVAAQKALVIEMQRQAASVFGESAQTPDVRAEASPDSFNSDSSQSDSSQSPTVHGVQGADAGGGLTVFERVFEGLWYGGVRIDPDEQQKRLQHAVRPEYPEAARLAGLEGDVTLRLVIGADGAVKDVRAIAGDPELARAAIDAVSQWQYVPALLDGRPVSVVTTVTLAFRLR
jgi:TonB family protein